MCLIVVFNFRWGESAWITDQFMAVWMRPQLQTTTRGRSSTWVAPAPSSTSKATFTAGRTVSTSSTPRSPLQSTPVKLRANPWFSLETLHMARVWGNWLREPSHPQQKAPCGWPMWWGSKRVTQSASTSPVKFYQTSPSGGLLNFNHAEKPPGGLNIAAGQ